jgi:hypothetical protein
MAIYIEFVKSDDAGIVPGSGWVLKENGKRIDWPMLTTRAEAVADVIAIAKARKFNPARTMNACVVVPRGGDFVR